MKFIVKTLFIISILFTSPIYAEMNCIYPAKVDIPNGSSSTKDEFVAGYNAIKEWIESMTEYMDCVDADTKQMIVVLKINQQYTPEAEATIIEHQDKKYNAAVEDQQKIAELLNIQVRAYKAAQDNN